MAKNVLIFSDGTGQAGGFRFDEERTNIYKLYRAARVGPDTGIDPREQVTFYDPGLGSIADGGNLAGRTVRWIYNLASKATGLGITANIVDCYAALIRLWQPGDRIFLFGFSRGAYTVRCLSEVISLCGIPTHLKKNQPLALDIHSTCKLAGYAVKHIYQFTESRSCADATDRKRFLLETRDLLGKRFREDYGSADGDEANVHPYFIGVFDTVASLGSPFKAISLAAAYVVAALILGAAIQEAFAIFTVGPTPHLFELPIAVAFAGIAMALAGIASLISYVYTHLKFDFAVASYNWGQSLRTIHLTELWLAFYDARLSKKVAYARHAMSIDENRKDFKRVGWGTIGVSRPPDAKGNRWFEQVWFLGNHADVGGGYSENESRLSDIALDWMVRSAIAIPNGLMVDKRVLTRWPYPDGMQHDEVKMGYGWLTRRLGITWTKQERSLPRPSDKALSAEIIHRSVYKRFDHERVQVYDRMLAYRPETLKNHVDFARFYQEGAPFPATSEREAECVAGEPKPTGDV